MCACVRACCACLSPRLLITIHVKWSLNQASPTAFQFLYVTLAVDITDGQGLSNEARRELLLKKSKVMPC